ncbi:MAG: diguanylate cyclase [Deltaproteobacteria bacterium]|nr:diguanylate cyclase [Deltaproteobacteria bacterium]
MAAKRPERAARAARDADVAIGRTILVAEDTASERNLLRKILTGAGYKVITASDGYEAIGKAIRQKVDLALLDIVMPRLNGLEATRMIKAEVGDRFVPVLLCTHRTDLQMLEDGYTSGADDYITKPIEPMELLTRVRSLLRIKAQNDRMAQLAITDHLTGLFNHRFFHERLSAEFQRSRRHRRELSLMMLDFDHFKQLNDTYGHPVGDRVLSRVGEFLKETLRESDMAFRYGGEEFSVLLPETGGKHAFQLAERIRKGISAITFPEKPGLRVTVSIGVATYPGHGDLTRERLISDADEALYGAKRDGRNRVRMAGSR